MSRASLILLLLFVSLSAAGEGFVELEGRMRLNDGETGVAVAFRDSGGLWRIGLGIDSDGLALYSLKSRPEPVTRNWELFVEGEVMQRGAFDLNLGASSFIQTLEFPDPARFYISTFVTAGAAPRISLEWNLSRRFTVFTTYAPRIFYSSHISGSLQDEFELDVYPLYLAPHLYFMWSGPVYLGGRFSFGILSK